MTEVLEIYRPILGSGAEELAECAVEIAGVLGIVNGYSHLRWGESPRVGLISIAGDLGLELYEKKAPEISTVISAGNNAKDFKLRKLIPWDWDLPKDREQGSTLNPRIEIGENPFIKDLPKAGNSLFWRLLTTLTGEAHYGGSIDTSTSHSIRKAVIRNVVMIGLENTNPILTSEEFRSKRRILLPLIPRIVLGPMCMKYGEQAKEDYGYLAVE